MILGARRFFSMKQDYLESLTGIFILIIAGLFIFFMYQKSGYEVFVEGIPYRAQFDRVDGLKKGSQVKIAGVIVGEVASISMEPKTYMARVVFHIKKDIYLPDDSSAEITSDGLMGEKYLSVVPGGSEKFLSPNGSVRYTQSSVSLESMIGQLIFSQKKDPKGASHEKAADES